MGEGFLEDVLGDLNRSFDAALSLEEETAADDLAWSLRQDKSLRDALKGWETIRLCSGDLAEGMVTEVGSDYVSTGGPRPVMVPLARSVLRPAGPGPRAGFTERTLLSVLRERARRGAKVQVRSYLGPVTQGRLTAVSSDHLIVESLVGEVAVAWGLVTSITCLSGG